MYKFPSVNAEITYFITGTETPFHLTEREKIMIDKFVEFHKEKTQDLVQALRDTKPYVENAYECAFPDESQNQYVLEQTNNVLNRFEEKTENS
jgi:hypothetical protein